jgi:flagellar motor switch protein FliM
MDPSFCMFFVEHQSGGRSMKLGEARSLTRIEERVMGRTIKKIFKELSRTWSSYVKMTILHHVYESKPANIRTISSHIPGIAVTFMLEVDNMKVPLRLCYPYALLKEQMMSSFGDVNSNDTRESLSSGERLQFQKEMKNVDVMAKAMLGKSIISLQRLIGLQEGDVVKLDQRIDEPLIINVNDRHKMTGYPGVKSGKKAVKVFDILKND